MRIPLTDLRPFAADSPATKRRLPQTWSSPREFVRRLGAIERRARGSTVANPASAFFCDFRNTVRFAPDFSARFATEFPELILGTCHRRIYKGSHLSFSFSFAVDFAFDVRTKYGVDEDYWSLEGQSELHRLVRWLGSQPITHPLLGWTENRLVSAGGQIASTFEDATGIQSESGAVVSGVPAFSCQIKLDDMEFGRCPEKSFLTAAFIRLGQEDLPIWTAIEGYGVSGRSDAVRDVAAHQLKLHHDREVSKSLIRGINQSLVSLTRGDPANERLQGALHFLNSALTKAESYGFNNLTLAGTHTFDLLDDERTMVLHQLGSIRPSLLHAWAQTLRDPLWQGAAPGTTHIYIEEFTMSHHEGDNITITDSTIQNSVIGSRNSTNAHYQTVVGASGEESALAVALKALIDSTEKADGELEPQDTADLAEKVERVSDECAREKPDKGALKYWGGQVVELAAKAAKAGPAIAKSIATIIALF